MSRLIIVVVIATLFSISGLFLNGHAVTHFERGWAEHARIMPVRIVMTAKLDSGALNSSIHADSIEFSKHKSGIKE